MKAKRGEASNPAPVTAAARRSGYTAQNAAAWHDRDNGSAHVLSQLGLERINGAGCAGGHELASRLSGYYQELTLPCAISMQISPRELPLEPEYLYLLGTD